MNKKFKITFFGWLYITILLLNLLFLAYNNLAPLPQAPADFKGNKALYDSTTSRDYKNILIPVGAIILTVAVSFIHVLHGYYKQIKEAKK
jgi:hypothetical protein